MVEKNDIDDRVPNVLDLVAVTKSSELLLLFLLSSLLSSTLLLLPLRMLKLSSRVGIDKKILAQPGCDDADCNCCHSRQSPRHRHRHHCYRRTHLCHQINAINTYIKALIH